jgi:hypothetical protein
MRYDSEESVKLKRSRGFVQTGCALFAVALFGGCTTLPFARQQDSQPSASFRDGADQIRGPEADFTNDIQIELVQMASRLNGYRGSSIVVRDREFTADCTGVVMAIHYGAGIDLTPGFRRYTGNGVHRLYRYLDAERLIYTNPPPHIGDIVFWDNTYDRNNNRRFDDPLTHMGLVVDVDFDGSITFVHHNYREGIVFAEMNLSAPDSWEQNAPMRMRGARPRIENRILAGRLFRGFGQGWRIRS